MLPYRGLTFRFYFDSNGQLHALSYGVSIAEILEAWFEGQRTWNPTHLRWESRTAENLLYWAWYQGREVSAQVVIISAHPLDQ